MATANRFLNMPWGPCSPSERQHSVCLNACYSEKQAHAIAQHIDCVVGMSDAVGDESAVSFSASFYQALLGAYVQTAIKSCG